MNYFLFIPIIALLFNGLVWTYIFVNRKAGPVNRSYLLYATNLTLWILVTIVLRNQLPDNFILPILKIESIFGFSVIFWFMHFTYTLVGKKREVIYYCFATLTFVIVLLSLSTSLMMEGYVKTIWGYDEIGGILYLPAVAAVDVIPAVYVIYLIIRKLSETIDYVYKKSIQLVLIGSCFSLILGLTSNIVIPYFLGNRKLVQFAESATVIQAIFVFVAITKYKLFVPGVEEIANELFASMREAVFIFDKYGKVILMNNYAEKLFGVNNQVNKQFEIQDIFENLNIEENYSEQEYDFYLNGIKKYLSLSQTNIVKNGLNVGKILFVRDVTARKISEELLKESEEKYRAVVETLPHGVRENDVKGNITFVNTAFCKMFGYSVDELMGKKIWDMSASESGKQKFIVFFQDIVKNKPVPASEYAKYKTKEGKVLDVQIDWDYKRDKSGNVIGFISIITDITKRKQYETLLNKNKLMLMQAEELAHLGSWEWDIQKDIVDCSTELFKIYGIDINSFDNKFESLLMMTLPEDRDEIRNVINAVKQNGGIFEFYQKIIRPNGEIRTLLTKGISLTDTKKRLRTIYGSCLDVTEFKKVESELINSRERLRTLSSSLQATREDERSHMAREIHDELGQVLTAVKMDLTLLLDDIKVDPDISISHLQEQLIQVEKLIDRLINTVRDIATELRPDVLDHLGLVAALSWQAKEFEKRYKIKCYFNYNVKKINLENDKTTAIFRIFQEALTNIARHSNASKVIADLKLSDEKLLLTITDNGKGMAQDKLSNIKSIGLIGMKERGLILGGHVFIESKEGGGTKVSLEVPLTNLSNVQSNK